MRDFAIRMCIVCGMAASLSCGSNETCLQVVQEYFREKDNALVCDPASSDPCSDQAPVVYGLQDADGGFTPEGIAINCDHAVNAARSAKLHQILTRFHDMGCVQQYVPICQSIFNVCIPDSGRSRCGP